MAKKKKTKASATARTVSQLMAATMAVSPIIAALPVLPATAVASGEVSAPWGILFGGDGDGRVGYISGTVSVTRMVYDNEVAQDVAGYRLYWGSSASDKLGAPIYEWTGLGETPGGLDYVFAANTPIPSGATHLIATAFSAEETESVGISVSFADNAGANAQAIESRTIEVTFEEGIADGVGTIATGDFVLTGSDEIHLSSAVVNQGKMILIVDRDIVPGEALTLSYTPPAANKLMFADSSLPVTAFSGLGVINTLPIVDGADVYYPHAIRMMLTYPVSGTSADPNAFKVNRDNETPFSPSDVVVNGKAVTLLFESELAPNENYYVSYNPTGYLDLRFGSMLLPSFAPMAFPSNLPSLSGITALKNEDYYEFVIPNVPANATVVMYTESGDPISSMNTGTGLVHALVYNGSLDGINTVYIAYVEGGIESPRTAVRFNAAPVAKAADWADIAAYSNGSDVKPTFMLSLDGLFEDADGDELNYTYDSGNPSVVQVTLVTGGLMLTPTYMSGTTTVTINANDWHGNVATLHFNVSVGGDNPHASMGASSGSAKIDAVDVANGEALKLTFSNQPFHQLPSLHSEFPGGAVDDYVSGTDITGVNLKIYKYVGVYTVDAEGKVLRFTPVTIDESMLQSGLLATRTDGTALTLDGSKLHSAIVRLTVTGGVYRWKTTFAAGDIASDLALNGAPAGMSIASVYRISDKVLDVKLAYTGAAIGSPLNSLSITANASAFQSGEGELSSGIVPIAPPESSEWQSSLKAVGGEGQATVTFSAPVGADSVTTLVYADNESFYGRHTLNVDPASNSLVVSGLDNGQQYWFRLVVSGGAQPGISNVEHIYVGEPAPAAAEVPVAYQFAPQSEGADETMANGQSFRLRFNSLLDNRNGQVVEAIRQGLGSDFANKVEIYSLSEGSLSSEYEVSAIAEIHLTAGNNRIALAPGSVANRSGRTNDDYIAFDITRNWSGIRPVLALDKIGFIRDEYYGTPNIFGPAGTVDQANATITVYDWDGTVDANGEFDSDYTHLQLVKQGSSNDDGSFRLGVEYHDPGKRMIVLVEGRGENYSSGTYDSGMIYGIKPQATELVNKAVPTLVKLPDPQRIQKYTSFTLDLADYFADDDVLGYSLAGGYDTGVLSSTSWYNSHDLRLDAGHIGTTTITATATDLFGNRISQSFEISVEESVPTALSESQVAYYPAAGIGDTIVISGLKTDEADIRVYDASEGGRELAGYKMNAGEQAFDGTIAYQLTENLGPAGKDLWVTLSVDGRAESGRVKIGKQNREHALAFVNSFGSTAGFKLNPGASGTLRYVVLDSGDKAPSPTQIASGADSEWESVAAAGSFDVQAGVDTEFYLMGLDPYAIKRIYAVITDDEGTITPALTNFFYVFEMGPVSADHAVPFEVQSPNGGVIPYLLPGDLNLRKGDTLLLHFDRPVAMESTKQKISDELSQLPAWQERFTVDAVPVTPSSWAHTFRVHITDAITLTAPVTLALPNIATIEEEYGSVYFHNVSDYLPLPIVPDTTNNDAFHTTRLTVPNLGVRLDKMAAADIVVSYFSDDYGTASVEGGEENGLEEGERLLSGGFNSSDDYYVYDNVIAIKPGVLPVGMNEIHVAVKGFQESTVSQTINESFSAVAGSEYNNAINVGWTFVESSNWVKNNGVTLSNADLVEEGEGNFRSVYISKDYLAGLPTGSYTFTYRVGWENGEFQLSVQNPLLKIGHARGDAALASEITLQDLLDAGAAAEPTLLAGYQAAIAASANTEEPLTLAELESIVAGVENSAAPYVAGASVAGWKATIAVNWGAGGPQDLSGIITPASLIARDESGARITDSSVIRIDPEQIALDEDNNIEVKLVGAGGQGLHSVEIRPIAGVAGTTGPMALLPNTAPFVHHLEIVQSGATLTALTDIRDDEDDAPGNAHYQWYRSDEPDGTLMPIAGANGATYTVTSSDVSKYVRVLATPVSQSGVTAGVPVLSASLQQTIQVPTVTGVSVAEGSSLTLRVGDTLQLVIAADGSNYAADAIVVNGKNVAGTLVALGDNRYTISYTIAEGDTDRAVGDLVPVNVVMTNAGVANSPYSTSISNIAIDAHSPTPDTSVGAIATNRIGDRIKLRFNEPVALADASKIKVNRGTGTIAIDFSNTGMDPSDLSGRTISLALYEHVMIGDEVTVDLNAGAVHDIIGNPNVESIGNSAANKAAAPNIGPGYAHFYDENPNAGTIKGTVAIGRASDESDIEGYQIYWAKSDLTPVGASIATVPRDVSSLEYSFEYDTLIPAQAAGLAVRAVNAQGASPSVYIELVDAAGFAFDHISMTPTSLDFSVPFASSGTARVVVTDSNTFPWQLTHILNGANGSDTAIYTWEQAVQAGDRIDVSLDDLNPGTLYTAYMVIQASDGSYSPIETSSFLLPPPPISGTVQMFDVSGAANDGKTEIQLGAPTAGHSYKIKRWASSPLSPRIGDVLTLADGWMDVQTGDKLSAYDQEPFAVAEVDGTGAMVGLSFVHAIVMKEPPVLNADSTRNNIDEPIEITFTDNPDWRGHVQSVAIDGVSVSAAVYHLEPGKLVLERGAFTVAGLHAVEVLAEGYGPVTAMQQVLGRTAALPAASIAVGNQLIGNDTLSIASVPAGADIRVYDGATAALPFKIFTQGAAGPANIAIEGGYPAGLKYIHVSVTDHAAGYAESARTMVAIPLPGLSSPVSVEDAPGPLNDGKTKVLLGSPSAGENTFRYKLFADEASVAIPEIGDSAEEWTAIANGDMIVASNGQYIGVAEVNTAGEILAFGMAQAVVASSAPPLAVTIADAPGYANNGRTLITVDAPSAAGNTFKYKLGAGPIAIPNVGESAAGWTPLPANGLVLASSGQYIGVAEVDPAGNIVAFGGRPVVVKDALNAPYDFDISVDNQLAAGLNDKVTVANVPAGVTVNVYSESNGGTLLGSNTNGLAVPAAVDVAIANGFEPLKTAFYVGYSMNGLEDSARTAKLIPTPQLIVTFSDPAGAVNNGKTKVTITGTGAGNRFYYKPGSNVNVPIYSYAFGNGWELLPPDGIIDAANGTFISIAEGIDNNIIAVGGGTAVTVATLAGPAPGDIVVANNGSGADTVTVANVQAGATVSVYSTASGGTALGSNTSTSSTSGPVVVTIAGGLNPLLGTIYVELSQDGADVSERTPADVPASPLTVTTADLAGVANNGKTQVSVTGAPAGATLVYKAGGTAMPQPQAGSEAGTGWTALGAAGVANGVVSGVAQGDVIHVAVLNGTQFVAFGAGLATVVDTLAAPAAGDILFANAATGDDWMSVSNVPAGASVTVYDAASGGAVLGSGTSASGTVELAIAGGIDPLVGTIYVELSRVGMDASERTPVNVLAPMLTVTTSDIAGATNNGKTQVSVSGAPAGATLVYKVGGTALPQPQAGSEAGPGWTALGSAGAASGVVSGVAQGDVIHVAVLSGSRIIAYGSGTANMVNTLAAPAAGDITVTNNANGNDTVTVINVQAGVTVSVYSAASGGTALGSKIGFAGPVSVTIPGGFDGLLGTIYVELSQPGKEASERTAVNVSSLPLTVTTSDAAGAANNGKTQVTVTGSPAGAALVYKVGGSALPQPQAGSDAGTGWTALGAAGVTSGVVSGVAQGEVIHVAVLSGTQYVAYGSGTAVAVDALVAPAPGDIVVTNNASGADTVTVANVPAGASAYVYDAATGGNELGKAYRTGTDGDVTATIAGGLNPQLGTIYVELVQSGKETSERTAKAVLAPQPANAAQFSGSYEDSAKTTVALGAPSTAGNGYKYRLYDSIGDVQTPQAGALLADMGGSWMTVTNGDTIAAATNQPIGIVEVDASGRIVAFQTATAVHFQAAPALKADITDAFTDVPLDITTDPNDAAASGWLNAAADALSETVVTHTVGGATYRLSAGEYGFVNGKLVIHAGVFAAGEHQIRISVTGYTYANVALQKVGGPASEWAHIGSAAGTAIQAADGAIAATAQLVSSRSLTADQSIAFELWDDAGSTGLVQLFAGGSSGPYTARFPLGGSSTVTGATYRIKVYIVSNLTDDAGGNDLKLSAPVELPVTMFRELDANDDGRVGIDDLLAVVLHAPDSIRDVNHDGAFNREDVLALLRQIVGSDSNKQ